SPEGTDLRKTRSLQFACLVAAFSIAAAYQIISGKTMSVASPEDATEVEVDSALSNDFVTSALPAPRGSLVFRKEETSSDTLEMEQARIEAAFDALERQAKADALEQQARADALEQQTKTAALEPQTKTDSAQDYFPDAAPTKRNFSDLAYYVFSEI